MSGFVRLRPGRHFGGLIILVLLLWLVSANYNNNLGYILTYLLAGLALTAPFHTRRQICGIRWRLLSPKPVFAGETARLPLVVENADTRPKWRLQLALPGGEPVTFALDAGESRRLELPWATHERGMHRIGPVVLTTCFPLGWFQAMQTMDNLWELWVYPRPAGETPAPVTGMSAFTDGEREFQGFRAYQPGDCLRQIHWKGLAKGQGLVCKEFSPVDDRGETVFDWRRLPGGSVEQRLGWLCRWLLDAEREGLIYGLRVPGRSIAPDQGSRHLHARLRALAQMPKGRHD